jgi:hypothetical protein
MQVICHKTYLQYLGTKAILKGWKSGIFVNFCEFPYSWIRIWIRIPKTDQGPDPGEQNQWGSVRVRIRNTA